MLEPLHARQEDLLALIVRTHIASGVPVSSSEVARKYGERLSSATVRNEMAGLEEAGYLHQPHTSAGRLPTAKAYEFYARGVATRARLRPADQKRIQRGLGAEPGNADTLLARAPHVLSELCHGVGLVLAPPLGASAVEQIRLVRLDEHRVLVVVVTLPGLVRDRIVATPQPFRLDELERMTAYLNEHFRGWTLAAIRAELKRRVAAERSEFLRQALALCRESFDSFVDHSALHIEGVPNLIEAADAGKPEEWRELLQALEEKERLAQLLGDCLQSPDERIYIQIGLEKLSPAMQGFALVGARYGGGERPVGSLGLLGRTRMDYGRAITAVSYVAKLFNRLLTEN